MATYGPSRGKSKQTPARGTTRTASGRSSGSGDVTRQAPRSTKGSGGRASNELRHAIEGREHEFAGIGFIAVGLLIALSIYVDLAGPVGRAVETLIGWFTGLGRFVVPVALIGIGVALVRKGRSEHPMRLVFGWGIAALAILGLLHVVRGPEKWWADFDAFGTAGGWFGALVGEPLRSLVADAGAVVIFVALFIAGLLLITGSTVRALMSQTGRGVGAVAVPLGRAARRARTAFGDVTTLRSERESGELDRPSAVLYDAAADDDDVWAEPPPKPKRSRSKAASLPEEVFGPTEQTELELGPAAQRGAWVLPPANSLIRSEAQAINKAEVESRGRTLVDSLYSLVVV
jgi:S-DNA-T family DNA segregation ATPase FtsK/SpoIIIE